MFSEAFDRLLRLGPTSAIMPARDARLIAAKFGDLIIELYDEKRYTNKDADNKRVFSLPLKRLSHSKQDIQKALAVVVADLVPKEIDFPSQEQRDSLYAAVHSSGDLAYFTDRTDPGFCCYGATKAKSDEVYSQFRGACELQAYLTEPAANQGRSSEESRQYWQAIDPIIVQLLKEPILASIRET